MKKVLSLFLILTILSLLNLSCEENFSPKEDFKERNILYCIIEVEQTLQPVNPIVMLTQNYDNPAYIPPNDGKTAPSIPGANIRLKVNGMGSGYSFLEDTLTGKSVKPYMPEIYYKLANGAMSLSQGADLSISAALPDGKILSAKTRLPKFLTFEYSFEFKHGITTLMNRWLWGNDWTISWDSNDGNLFIPRLRIRYSTIKDSLEKFYVKEIPLKYAKGSNGYYPINPQPTREPHITFEYAAIDSAMAQISAGDPKKSDYYIKEIDLEIIEFDRPLSNYYTSTNGFMDNYSIRLDESVYSNVDGGIGIFGVSMKNSVIFSVDRLYLSSFGYSRKY
ncbi:MAG: DUF4249 family protein [Ignavibacteriales bacterium]|nr:DUF4249 family protein [Ignavibacteriales bacterium]